MASPFTILLVIDDPAFRGGLMTALRARGMKPVLMGDGEQARGFLAMETPAMVIVDPRIQGPGGGVEWIRARRAEGIRVPMLLCAATREEAQALLLQTDALGVASVIPKQAQPDTLAAHVEELLTGPAEPAEGAGDADTGKALRDAVEAVRVSIVNLQKDPTARERQLASLTACDRLRRIAKPLQAEAGIVAADKIEELIVEARDGRGRLDQSAWVVIERVLVRARESAGSVSASPPPSEVRRPSTSAHRDPLPSAGGNAPQSDVDIDEVSGVATRDAFLRDAEEKIQNAIMDERPLAFVMLGIDGADALRAERRFDSVLEAVGQFLLGRFRPDDSRGRWLLDAFCLALPATPTPMAINGMTRTLEAFAALRLANGAGKPITLSAGIAVYPKEGRDAPSALQTAEQRMRAAQKRGGGTVVG